MRVFRSLAAVAAAFLIVFVPALPARSQTEASDVVVEVVDAATGAPIRLARVLVNGGGIEVGYTDADGKARFESLPTGTYRAQVTKGGYARQGSPLFEVIAGRSTSIRVRLAKPGLKTIGSVSVSSRTTTASNEVGQENPLRFLDGSLQGAIGSIPGLTANGGGFALDGSDPSQTGFSIDGIAIPSAGGSLAASGINADLFNSASASTSPQNGALGGSVNFLSLNPTRLPQSSATLQYAGTNASAATIVTRGSIDTVGYVVEHAVRGATSPIDGLSYLDQSGLDYVHRSDATSLGDLVKLRWSPSLAETLTGTFISTNGASDLGCTAFASLTPCGAGPGNGSIAHGGTAVVSDLATVGATIVSFGFGASSNASTLDERNRYVGGAPSPANATFSSLSRFASFNVQFPAHDKHEFNLNASVNGIAIDSTSLTPLGFGSAQAATSYHGFAVGDTIRPNGRLTLGLSAGESGGGGGSSITGSLFAAWQPTSTDRFSATINAGSTGSSLIVGNVVPDAGALTYFCGEREAIGTIGTSALPHQRSTNAQAQYERSFKRGRLGLTAWTKRELGAPVTTALPASAFALPTGFLASVAATAQSPEICGAAAPAPQATFLTTVPADQVSRGATLSGSRQFGARSVIAAYASVQSRYVTSIAPAYAGPGSLVPNFAQVPNVPLHRAGIVATASLGANVDALANLNFTSANNPNALPAYALVNAGFAVKLKYGSLAIVGSNLTNRYAPPFATIANAVALPRFAAPPLPTLGQPLPPRTVSATYTVRVGSVGATGSGAQRRDVSSADDEGPTEITITSKPFPSAPPTSPPVIDPENDRCTVTAARAVQPVLDALVALARDAERAKRDGRYPAALPNGKQRINQVTLAYLAYGDGRYYAITIEPNGMATYAAVSSCLSFVGGSNDDAEKLHLYESPYEGKGLPPIIYSPLVGIYLEFPKPDPKAQKMVMRSVTFEPEPVTPPADPFALQSACPAAAKPLAQELVESVRTAYAGSAPPDIEGIVLIVRGDGPHRSVAIGFRDVLAGAGIESCLHIASIPPEHLAAAGLAPPRTGGIAFAPRFGFYVVTEK